MQKNPQKGSETQEVVRLRGLHAILTKIGACALRDAQLCGSDLEIYNGKPFSKGCLCRLISLSALVISLSSQGGEWGHLRKGNLRPAFRWIRGGQRTLPASVDSQLPQAQNNLYTKVAYFLVA